MPFLLFLALGATVAYLALDKNQVNALHKSTVLKAGRVYNLRLLNIDPSTQVTPAMVQLALDNGFGAQVSEVQFEGLPWTEANFVWSATVAIPGTQDVTFTFDTAYTVEDIGSALLSA